MQHEHEHESEHAPAHAMDGPAITEPAEARDRPGAGPVLQAERFVSLDILRGVAVLGILVMNIQSFSMIGAAYMNPTAYGDLTGLNYWVWYFSHLLADQKFMTIFSMLFGAGIVLMTSRAEARTGTSAGLHYRRMGWLILFGLLHAHLLWYGDILYTYGMCGLVAWLFRRVRPGILIVLGVLAIAVSSVLFVGFGVSMQFAPEEALRGSAEGWMPSAATVAAELEAYRGGWLEQMGTRAPTAVVFQTALFLIWGAWRAGGLMLVGMGLFKLGVFSARRGTGLYAGLVAAALLVGIPVLVLEVRLYEADGWSFPRSMFHISQINYWASLVVSLGWVGAVMLFSRVASSSLPGRALAAVGQMAFTNYIMQTVICTTIFYGHGFGAFGSVSRVGQLGVVLAVWAAQIALSPVWLRHFRFGPLEWLWRSLTYARLQPFRRSSVPRAPAT